MKSKKEMKDRKGRIIFITGGARSGKSSFALSEALKVKGRKAYIATAEALDSEMKERIKRHKKDRGDVWDTFEEPLGIANVIKKIKDRYSVILLDCLTLWLSNLLTRT
ncbi:MAG: bifunctional adenosylcobinamide kinase/adenosylcobinamide-phosphate guanylyltransferase, partial [Nitrospirae bacterium]|nr:bifunctional adenosylcobinamide kinase/adenosylcobinamide-phosphate guanylyltransferase [Nitrospirota bacterium]